MTYDYHCAVCKQDFEATQSIKDEPHAECPSCKVVSSQRLISCTNFVLKGDGWGKDLYAKKA